MSFDQRTDQQPPASTPWWYGQHSPEQPQQQQPYQQQPLYPGELPSARRPARTAPPSPHLQAQVQSADIPAWHDPRKWWSISDLPQRTKVGIVVTIASGVLALIIIGLLAVGGTGDNASASSGPQSTVSATHPVGSGARTPVTAASPTATKGPSATAVVFAPVLGGTVSDFAQLYGPPQDPSNIQAGVWQQLSVAGESVALSVSTAPSQDSQDGELHVMNLQVTSTSNANWDSSTVQQLMAVFLPSDARVVQQTSNTKSEIIYTSADLEVTFEASLFKDYAGTKSVAPGTFSEQCFLGTSTAKVGGNANSCLLTVGTY